MCCLSSAYFHTCWCTTPSVMFCKGFQRNRPTSMESKSRNIVTLLCKVRAHFTHASHLLHQMSPYPNKPFISPIPEPKQPCLAHKRYFFYFNNWISERGSTLRNLETYLQLRFWCMSLCRLADRCHWFRQTWSLHLPGGRWDTGHPIKFHIHNTSERDKVNCHLCPQIPSDYILLPCVNSFMIIAAAYTLAYKKSVSADMQPAQWGSQVTTQLWMCVACRVTSRYTAQDAHSLPDSLWKA